MLRSCLALAAFSITICFPAIHAAQAAGFEILVPHRAAYDVRLKDSTERSGIEAMTGRIVYEITGNECEGVTIRYRFVTNITSPDTTYQTDQQVSTFESPDGKEFTFLTKTFVDRKPENEVRGSAVRTAQGLKVELAAPQARQLALPDGIFMSSHMINVIEKARAGETLVRAPVFDGSEGADEVVLSSTFVGSARMLETPVDGETAEAIKPLAGMEAWPVTISYFDSEANNSAEQVPSYEASFLLYPNGVSRRLVMRYPDYSLTGELSSLEMLAATPCSKKN
jgi:hypothetical protein